MAEEQCPYAPIYCNNHVCDLCWNYLSLEVYGIRDMLDMLKSGFQNL